MESKIGPRVYINILAVILIQAFCFLIELGEGVVVLEREPKRIN